MNISEIELQMKELWKNVFHDSKEYIDLIFKNYFTPEYIGYKEENGSIISSYIAVPYTFTNGTDSLKALYLCGLATDKNHRGQGIMGGLLKEAEEKYKNTHDFLFLIPAQQDLIPYYDSHNFYKGIYRNEDRYTPAHNFVNDFELTLIKTDDRIKELKLDLFRSLRINKYSGDEVEFMEIVEYITEKENSKKNYAVLSHSEKDLSAVVEENHISGGDIFICKDSKDKINGIAFCLPEDIKLTKVSQIYSDNPASYYKLLDHIKSYYEDNSLRVIRYPSEEHPSRLWEEVYISSNPDSNDLDQLFGVALRIANSWERATVYGLVNILNFPSVLSYMLKNNQRHECSVFIKNDNKANDGVAIISNGEKAEILESEDYHKLQRKYPNLTILTKKEVSGLLFNKKEKNSLLTDIFGISPLRLNMSLLLD